MQSDGEVSRVGLLQLSDNAAQRVSANKTSHSAQPLESHHKAICNMSKSGASDRSRNKTRFREKGGWWLVGKTAGNCDTLNLCKSDFGSLCNVEKRK